MDYKIFGRATSGATVPIVVRVRSKTPQSREMPLTSVNGVDCTIKGPAGTTIVSGGHFLFVEEGVYLFNWDTSGLSAGTYYVTVNVGTALSGDVVSQSGIVRLF